MKFIEQLQIDLKQAMHQHQHQLLLEVLQRRSQELTLGDLRTLLTSPLGRGLDDIRLALIFSATTTPASLLAAVEVKPGRVPVRKQADKQPVGKQKAALAQRSNPSQELVAAVGMALQSTKTPLSTTDLATTLNVHRTTIRAALQKLAAQKRITISGKGKFTRYAISSAQPTAASASKPSAKGGKRQARSKKTSQPAVSPPAPSSSRRKGQGKATPTAKPAATQGPVEAQSYDAAVLACLREKGQAASSELLAVVGGTIDRLRVALIRLASTGQIVRTGERKLTRYSLQSQG